MNDAAKLPGTNLPREKDKDPADILEGLFLGGGLVLSQVTEIIGIEGYTVQNWVRRGYLTPPQNKRYTERQFCRILLIDLLKDSLNIGEITDLISRINGQLNDESDDLIDDAQLYVYFVRLLDACASPSTNEVRAAARSVTADFPEPFRGVRDLLCEILMVMYLAYNSSQFLRGAREVFSELPACTSAGEAG